METSEQMKLFKRAPANRLSFLQSRALAELLEKEFKEMKLNDVEFAAYATDKLKFPVNHVNIKGLRTSLNIPSNVVRVPGGKAKKKSTNAVRFEEMAERYDKLVMRHDALATHFADLQSRVLALETFAKALQKHRNEG